ncbi:CBS and ACT domain-containing protein [Enterococcus bulliens]|uniref:CBS and ACT domain-containing protein n=1 Tax=uncultured Enterococcus sp. TaxID=167972 RepID=UPI0025D53B7E|nr:CBS and ACT domain-containing protein [uncultured Enterococcus sp.]
MSVQDFMTKTVVTVTPDTPVFDAIDLMKQHEIHRLPVMQEQKLVGLITEGIIHESLPSKATSLSVYELNYLITKTKVGDVMLKQVETIAPDALLEQAIAKMRQKNIAVLPVLDETTLVGIITNNDIFDAFLKITGYTQGGTRVAITIVDDQLGIIAKVAQLLADHQLSIVTVVVDHQTTKTIIEVQVDTTDTQAVETLLTNAGYEAHAVLVQP